MTTPPTIQTNPLDPVFSGVPVVISQGGLVNPTWNKWFVDLREKVNVINATLAAWSGIAPVTGLTPGTYGDATHYPKVTVNEFGLITAIAIQSVSGGGGAPRHITNVTSSYTVTAADIPAAASYRGLISVTSPSANQITIDKFANTSISVGSDLIVFQNGSGASTISSVPGVTLLGPSITGGGQFSSGNVIQIATDVWSVSGNLAWISGLYDPYYTAVMADNPLFYVRLNETSGTTSTSVGSLSISGTYTGGFTLQQPSLCLDSNDYSILLNGSTGYVDYGAQPGMKLTSSFTLEALVNPAAIGSYLTIFGYNNGGPIIRINTAGAIQLLSSQVTLNGTSTGVLTATTKYHIAVTISSTGASIFYINGSASGTGPAVLNYGSPSGTVSVGRDVTSGGITQYPFNGYVDEVAYYGSVLSAARILAHAQAGGFA